MIAVRKWRWRHSVADFSTGMIRLVEAMSAGLRVFGCLLRKLSLSQPKRQQRQANQQQPSKYGNQKSRCPGIDIATASHVTCEIAKFLGEPNECKRKREHRTFLHGAS